ncbi:hypothetical protein [Parafrankia soli]|uniref:hypothetical protein n=1 Tax=Parafrankia soli TaxID=2599596 RepID=UPI003B847B67
MLVLVNGHGGNYVLSNIVQEANVDRPAMWPSRRRSSRLTLVGRAREPRTSTPRPPSGGCVGVGIPGVHHAGEDVNSCRWRSPMCCGEPPWPARSPRTPRPWPTRT